MFAYIPARIGSKRIPEKNIKLLNGKPLITYTIETLKELPFLKGIAVSTDSSKISDIVNCINGCCSLELRDGRLADDSSSFMDLVDYDIQRFADYFQDEEVLFVLPTAVLVKSESYKKAFEKFRSNPDSLIMSVTPYETSAFLSFFPDEKKASELNPLFEDCFVKQTAELPPTFYDSGCFYLFKLTAMKGRKKFLDLRPLLYVPLMDDEGLDLDTIRDWEKLKRIKNV